MGNKEAREEIKKKVAEAFHSDRDIEIIPPKERIEQNLEDRKIRVAAYCRVSTNSEEQAKSYQTQKEFFEEYINAHKNWVLCGIFADEGLSATSTKNRVNFLKMIELCKKGEIDLIVTKSIDRFARNTVDFLSYARELKALNPPVGIYFHNENLNTLNQTGEMLISILANLAQAESERKSSSIKWCIRARFAEGAPKLQRCLGYEIQDDTLVIHEEEAKIVQMIYHLYLEGNSIGHICTLLNNAGVKTRFEKKWSFSSIFYILTNEKYCGDILMQKTVAINLFPHKTVKNNGIEAQYRIRDFHSPIIDRQLWEKVQKLIREKSTSSGSPAQISFIPTSSSFQILNGFKQIVVERSDKKWKPN